MSSKIRTSLLSLTVIAVLIFSAIGPTIVYADDGKPPETTAPDTIDSDDESSNADAGECDSDKEGGKNKKNHKNKSRDRCKSDEATDTSGNESESSDANSGEDTSGGDGAPDGTGTDATNGDPAEEASAPAADTPPAELLSQVPENTSVTVLNAEGQPEPLATQVAADTIASTTDPIWCPQVPGQPPTPPIPGANGCTPPFDSFDALLTFLAGNAAFQGAGTIYVEQGTYGGGESSIDFNNYNLSNISSSDLTVQGGWDPATSTTTSTSNFTVPIIIGSSTNPWGGSLTISNLVITGAAQTGLTLYSQNDITLSNVSSTDSVAGAGAELDAGGNVTVNNSNFLRNNTAGAIIKSGSNVSILNSDFSNTINQRRQITGLDITSAGSVSLSQVLANGNRRRGVDINAGGRVTIGASEFSETNGLNGGVFYGYGLRVVTPDAIDLSFVTANNNFLWGADLDAGGDVNISDSIFNANSTESPTFIDDTGLLVTSGGAVTLNRVQANGNRLIGATIDAVGIVNIDSSTFSDNQGVIATATGPTFHGLGLQVVSASNVLLTGVTASGNGLTGAIVDGAGITITNSTFSSNTTGSTTDLLGNGLLASGTGNVVLFNVTMDGNQLNGATIQTTANAILDTVTATNNGENGVQTEAACTGVINGTYSGNGQYGLFLVNPALSLSGSPVFANNTLGDIFPPNYTPCTLPFSIGGGTSGAPTTGSNNTGSSSNLQQTVSYGTDGKVSGALVPGISLNSALGITREVIGNSVVTSIFTGRYIYVYTVFEDDSGIDNLQIIYLTPAPATGVAMVGP